MHYLNGEYLEGARLFYSLLGRLKSRNLLLLNLCLCHLHSREYEEVLDLQSEIEKKENYLDFNEKQLRMMGLLAREKLKAEEPHRYERYMKIQRDKEMRNEWESSMEQSKSRITTPILQPQVRPSIGGASAVSGRPDSEAIEVIKKVPKKVTTPALGDRYKEVEEKEITIVDENKPLYVDKTPDIQPNEDVMQDNFSTIIR